MALIKGAPGTEAQPPEHALTFFIPLLSSQAQMIFAFHRNLTTSTHRAGNTPYSSNWPIRFSVSVPIAASCFPGRANQESLFGAVLSEVGSQDPACLMQSEDSFRSLLHPHHHFFEADASFVMQLFLDFTEVLEGLN